MSKYFSVIALLIVIVIVAALFYKVMAGVFVPLFLAALLVVIFRPIYMWMEEKCRGRRQLAAFLTTGSVLLAVLIPLALLFVMAAFESQQLLKSFDKAFLLQTLETTRTKLNLSLPEIADDFNAVQIQLDNISETDRLEDIANLDWQLQTAQVYNQDLAERLGGQNELADSIEHYIQSFEDLVSIQEQIAAPLREVLPEKPDDADFDKNETDDPEPKTDNDVADKNPAVLLHDFQLQLEQTRDLFSELKVQAMGGSAFWIWLRETANPTSEILEEYGSSLIGFTKDYLLGLGKTTSAFLAKVLIGLGIMIFSLYFFLLDGPVLLDSIKQLSPIEEKHEQELIDEFGKVSRAVVVATLAAALVQALLGGIGYYFAGLNSVFLLTLLTGCLALVPFVGAAAVWVPCTLWLFFIDNNFTAAIGLGLWGIVISSSDNFIKPFILHGQSNIHPLFALLSILGGVSVLGPIGILIGPMLFAFLQTLLKILQREIASFDAHEANGSKTTRESSKQKASNANSAGDNMPPAKASS